jgi:hypothetical protein
MCEKFSAVFKKRNGDIEVFYVHDQSGDKTYLGTMDRADHDDIYKGKYVFNLAAAYIARRYEVESIHIPVNVLREIADFEAEPKNNLSVIARSKSELRKRR